MRKKVRTYCFLQGLVVFPFLFIYLSNNEKNRADLFIKGVNLEAAHGFILIGKGSGGAKKVKGW